MIKFDCLISERDNFILFRDIKNNKETIIDLNSREGENNEWKAKKQHLKNYREK